MVVATSRTRKSSTKEKKDGKMKKESKKSSPSRVDKALVVKAVTALVKYHTAQATKKEEERSTMELLGNDRPVQVQFGLEVPPTDSSLKPIRVLIPNPILQVEAAKDNDEGLEEPDVCLIVKEDSKARVKEMIEEFKDHMGCVKKVLGLDSLRKKHGRFQQRRELLQKYDVFMADDRILPMLTTVLGKDFIKAKKLPLPIRITRKEALPFAIQRNLSATYMTVSRGTSIMVKAGNTGMPEKKLVENIVAIAENAVEKIPRKWANIRSIAIKTPESTSLPFYHKLPEELLEIAKLAGVAPAFKEVLDDKNADKPSEDESPKKKRELAEKSPLIRALKKQKKDSSSDKETKDDATSKKNEKSEKTTTKEGKKSKPLRENKKRVIEEADSEETKSQAKKSPKSEEKKRRKESKPDDGKKKEMEDFVASKKFKGSKKGYVFRTGKDGVGYYKDVKPVVDKMVLAALTRSASQGGSKGKRSNSVGKRRGRR